MDIGEVLSRAWQIIWKNKVLLTYLHLTRKSILPEVPIS